MKDKKWWDYEVFIKTGFPGAELKQAIDLRDFGLCEKDWSSKSDQEKAEFFLDIESGEELLNENIQIGIRHPKDEKEKKYWFLVKGLSLTSQRGL